MNHFGEVVNKKAIFIGGCRLWFSCISV